MAFQQWVSNLKISYYDTSCGMAFQQWVSNLKISLFYFDFEYFSKETAVISNRILRKHCKYELYCISLNELMFSHEGKIHSKNVARIVQ